MRPVSKLHFDTKLSTSVTGAHGFVSQKLIVSMSEIVIKSHSKSQLDDFDLAL